jgi:hypothetical protein
MADQPTSADQDSLAPRRSQASARQSASLRPPSIVLVDHTQPPEPDAPPSPIAVVDEEDGPGEASSARARPGLAASLRDQKQRWRPARHSADRPAGSRPGTAHSGGAASDGEREGSAWGRGTFDRQRRHLREMFRARHREDGLRGGRDEGAEYDVLYQNQRGAFVLGMPFFSSKALSQFEPSAWTDGDFEKSRVGVADAQLPDPSWEWAWRSWYVDMGGDVDEEGWEYSFWFWRGCGWHGTHPWFSSFVRRRRWLRKRVRRRGRVGQPPPGEHGMNPEYFTIHSDQGRIGPDGLSRSPSMVGREWGVEENVPWEEADMSDIATLLRALKEAPVDSERISLIKRYLEQGGDDLNYLADEVCLSTLAGFAYCHRFPQSYRFSSTRTRFEDC